MFCAVRRLLLGWQSSFRLTTGISLFFKRNKIMYYKELCCNLSSQTPSDGPRQLTNPHSRCLRPWRR